MASRTNGKSHHVGPHRWLWTRLRAVANRHGCVEESGDVSALVDHWPPVVEQKLERSPHRHPSSDDESLTQDAAERDRREPHDELGEHEEDHEYRETNDETDLTPAH